MVDAIRRQVEHVPQRPKHVGMARMHAGLAGRVQQLGIIGVEHAILCAPEHVDRRDLLVVTALRHIVGIV